MIYFASLVLGSVSALMFWSGVYNQNGFKELGKLLRGEPSFIPENASGGGSGSIPKDAGTPAGGGSGATSKPL